MATRPKAWLEERFGVGQLMGRLLNGRVSLKGAWLRTTGLACLILLLVEAVSGIALSQFYTPAPGAAFKDVQMIQQDHLGRFIRGIHHWGSATLIVLALLTVVRMFFGGEYKRRHDVVWIVSVMFSQFVLLFQLTGHLLPWDTNAVSTANVEAGFAANIWAVGPFLRRLILGGSAVGANTLTRWYGLHVVILPIACMLLIGIPLLAYRLHQGSADAARRRKPGEAPPEHYYPIHMGREMLVSSVVFIVVLVLAVSRGAPLELEATATNLGSNYQALAEWYVLPMHALTLIPPFNKVEFEPIATFVLPVGLIVLLIGLPFIDRNPSRRMAARPYAVASGVFVLAVTGGLYLYAFLRERPLALKQMERVALLSGDRAPTLDIRLVNEGKKQYENQQCSSCHAIAGKGGASGPPLTAEGLAHPERDWQFAHLVKPDSKVPGSTMPPYGHLKENELHALVEYMVSLR